MISKAFNLALFLLHLCVTENHAATPNEVADKIDLALVELNRERISKSISEIEPVASKYLEGISDEERIRGIDHWMNRQELPHRIHGPASVGSLLLNDPEMITDSTELRKMLATESDPPRFFLLACFAGYFTQKGETFIAEKSRMLFHSGRVAPQTSNNSRSSVLFDVSAFTYEEIVTKLKQLNAGFDEATMLPSEGQIPYPEKIPVLAKWLKDHWPGCEDLVIPTSKPHESKHRNLGLQERRSLRSTSNNDPSESSPQHSQSWAASAIIAAFFVLICTVIFWKIRTSNMRP